MPVNFGNKVSSLQIQPSKITNDKPAVEKENKNSSSKTVKTAVTASGLTALASVGVAMMAVKKGNAKALAEGLKQGIQQGKAEGLAQGLKQGVRQGFKQGKKTGFVDGAKFGAGKGKYNDRIDLATFKQIGGKFKKGGKATINGKTFKGIIVTPKGEMRYLGDKPRLSMVRLNDGTFKRYHFDIGGEPNNNIVMSVKGDELVATFRENSPSEIESVVLNCNLKSFKFKQKEFKNGQLECIARRTPEIGFVHDIKHKKVSVDCFDSDIVTKLTQDGKRFNAQLGYGGKIYEAWHSKYDPKTKMITAQIYRPDKAGKLQPTNDYIQYPKGNKFDCWRYKLDENGQKIHEDHHLPAENAETSKEILRRLISYSSQKLEKLSKSLKY